MKKLLLLVTLFVSLAAQAYEPLIREDRVWEYQDIYQPTGVDGKIRMERYCFDGSTDINGIHYHNFVKIGEASWQFRVEQDGNGNLYSRCYNYEPLTTEHTVMGYMREICGKVYLFNPVKYDYITLKPTSGNFEQDYTYLAAGEEILLYDFTLKENDTFPKFVRCKITHDSFIPDCKVEMQVNEIISEPEQGREFICGLDYQGVVPSSEIIDREYSRINFTYKEGVGNIGKGDMIGAEYIWLLNNGETTSRELNNLYDLEGKIIYKGLNDSFPTTGIDNISTNYPEPNMRMYDLMGREIRNPQPGTIYIQNGEKLIAR